MSLLADLLAKIKHESKEGGVPPNLAHAIRDSRKQRLLRRRLVFTGVAVLLFVIAGFGAIRYFETLSGPSFVTKASEIHTQRSYKPTPSVAPAGVSQPVRHSETNPSRISQLIEAKETKAPLEIPVKKVTAAHHLPDVRTEVAPKFREKGEPCEKHTGLPKEPLKEEKDSLLYTARRYEEARDYEQSLFFYKKALALDEKNYAIMSNIAGALIRAGKFEEAVKYSREAVEISKDYGPALVNLGVALAQSGMLSEARAFLSKALVLDVSNEHALLNLGLLFEKGRDFTEAERVYKKLAQLGNVQGDIGSARVAEKTGKNEDAKRIYRRILAMNPIGSTTRELAMARLTALEGK